MSAIATSVKKNKICSFSCLGPISLTSASCQGKSTVVSFNVLVNISSCKEEEVMRIVLKSHCRLDVIEAT